MSVIEYSGEEPKKIPSENQKLILEVMLKQLEIMKQMGQTDWLIPAGTNIKRIVEPK